MNFRVSVWALVVMSVLIAPRSSFAEDNCIGRFADLLFDTHDSITTYPKKLRAEIKAAETFLSKEWRDLSANDSSVRSHDLKDAAKRARLVLNGAKYQSRLVRPFVARRIQRLEKLADALETNSRAAYQQSLHLRLPKKSVPASQVQRVKERREQEAVPRFNFNSTEQALVDRAQDLSQKLSPQEMAEALTRRGWNVEVVETPVYNAIKKQMETGTAVLLADPSKDSDFGVGPLQKYAAQVGLNRILLHDRGVTAGDYGGYHYHPERNEVKVNSYNTLGRLLHGEVPPELHHELEHGRTAHLRRVNGAGPYDVVFRSFGRPLPGLSAYEKLLSADEIPAVWRHSVVRAQVLRNFGAATPEEVSETLKNLSGDVSVLHHHLEAVAALARDARESLPQELLDRETSTEDRLRAHVPSLWGLTDFYNFHPIIGSTPDVRVTLQGKFIAIATEAVTPESANELFEQSLITAGPVYRLQSELRKKGSLPRSTDIAEAILQDPQSRLTYSRYIQLASEQTAILNARLSELEGIALRVKAELAPLKEDIERAEFTQLNYRDTEAPTLEEFHHLDQMLSSFPDRLQKLSVGRKIEL